MDRRALVLSLAVAAASCGGSATVPMAPPPVAPSVTISGSTAGLAPNMKVQFEAVLQIPDGPRLECTTTATWSSSNEKLLKPTSKAGEFLVVDAGDSTVSAACSGATGTFAVHVNQPTSWPVSGHVIAGPGGAPIPGATLAFGSLAPVTTSASGDFTIVTPNATVQSLIVSAQGFTTRETFLRGGTLRSVDVDLLGGDLFDLYRRMAHNGSEQPQNVATTPTKRWTQNPNIFIWTTWRDTGAAVANLDFYITQIRRVIPQLSGGTLEAGVIETSPADRPLTTGWINVVFDHGGNNGILGGNPGRVQLAGDFLCNQIAITHEFGHAMGYWHTGLQNTIMGSTPGYCHDADFTPTEMLVAKAMYARANGNRYPDREPDASSSLSLKSLPSVTVYCPIR